MKTKHILLLGLGSLTATAAIATPIALVNSDFGGGGKPTRIVVGNVNNDSATLQIPFSEKISSTKATVTLVYENKEEQVEAEIVNDNDGTKVILTNLKPNTKYQIKQMKFDDKIINFKDSQFATKDNTLEQDVVVKPNEEQKLPKTVDKTDENKEESKKSDNQQEDKHEQGQSTKVEEPVVTPGVGAQEPAVSLPQKVEANPSKDNSAEPQKEEEKPKDQPDNNGPSSNISVQKEEKQPEPEVKQQPATTEVEKQQPAEGSNKESAVASNGNSSSSVETEGQTQPQKNTEQQSQASSNEDSQPNGTQLSNVQSGNDSENANSEQNNVVSVEKTEVEAKTLGQTSENTEHQNTNPVDATTNNHDSNVTINQETDNSTIIRVGYWRTDGYSAKTRDDRTTLFTKVIKNINLSLIVVSDIVSGQGNDGEKIVEQLNEENNPNGHWKQLTAQTDKQKSKISFIYNSDVLNPTPEHTNIKLSENSDSSYVIKPVSLTFETKKGKKIFSFVSSIFNATGPKKGKKGKGEEKKDTEFDGQGKNEIKQAKELEEEISKLTSNTNNNIIFMGSTNILGENQDKVFEKLLEKYESQIKEPTKINKNNSGYDKRDVTVFTKKDANFTVEHPTRFDLLDFMSKKGLKDTQTKHAPVYVDLKFN